MRTGALIAPVPSRSTKGSAVIAPRHDARRVVQALLSATEGFAALDPPTRTALAGSLAKIGSTALDNDEAAQAAVPRQPLARAQNAGSEFSGTAVDRVAGTTRNILNAVSFPRFVNELITGVFKAMNDSNQQQLTSFVDLIRNVAQTTEGFADGNVGVSGARAWLAEHFPGSYQIDGGDEIDMASELEGLDPAESRQRREEIQAEQDAATRLIVRPGATPPTEAALRTALGAPEGTTLNGSDPEALVPLARQVLARNRQQLLATMIQMGLQRIVIESGKVKAAMKLHVDANSAATNDRGSQFDMRNTTEVGVGAKFGPWGAEAKMQNTIGYVSTDRTQTTEGINASVDLDSGVELVFKTDYVPLNRLAGAGDVNRIQGNSLNPDAEAARLAADAAVRTAVGEASMAERRRTLDAALHTPAALPPSTIDTARLAGGSATPPAPTRPATATTPPNPPAPNPPAPTPAAPNPSAPNPSVPNPPAPSPPAPGRPAPNPPAPHSPAPGPPAPATAAPAPAAGGIGSLISSIAGPAAAIVGAVAPEAAPTISAVGRALAPVAH